MMHIDRHSLSHRIALVTGAGSGIGKASAKLLAHAGAAVGLLDLNLKEIEETSREIIQNGGRALAIQADICRLGDLTDGVNKIMEKWGRLDIVFANAGINGVWAPIQEITEEEWDRTMDINLKGTFLTIQQTIPLLKVRGGVIIVTASINGTRIFSNTGATAYACSKAGQVALVKMLALELARDRIRVNVICPGFIESKINDSMETRNLESIKFPVEFPEGDVPLKHGQPGTPGQVAELVWFLCSDVASHITGTEIYIDGAQSLIQG